MDQEKLARGLRAAMEGEFPRFVAAAEAELAAIESPAPHQFSIGELHPELDGDKVAEKKDEDKLRLFAMKAKVFQMEDFPEMGTDSVSTGVANPSFPPHWSNSTITAPYDGVVVPYSAQEIASGYKRDERSERAAKRELDKKTKEENGGGSKAKKGRKSSKK